MTEISDTQKCKAVKSPLFVVVEHGSVSKIFSADPTFADAIDVVVLDLDHEGRDLDELVICEIGDEKFYATRTVEGIVVAPVTIEGEQIPGMGNGNEVVYLCGGCGEAISRPDLTWLEKNAVTSSFHREGTRDFSSMVPAAQSGGGYPFHSNCAAKAMRGG